MEQTDEGIEKGNLTRRGRSVVLRVSAVGLGIAMLVGQQQAELGLAAPASEMVALRVSAATHAATATPTATGTPVDLLLVSPEPATPPTTSPAPDSRAVTAPTTPTRVVEVSSARSAPRNPASTPSVSFSAESTTDSVGLTVEVLPARSAPSSLPEAGSPNNTRLAAWLATVGIVAVAMGTFLSTARKAIHSGSATGTTTTN